MKLLFLAVFFIFFLTAKSWAVPRIVNLEWEPDPAAVSYEIEIGKKGAKKAFSKQSEIQNWRWSGPLVPGQYWMRVRGQDDRGLAGDWSEPVDFQVRLEAPEPVSPSAQEFIKSNTPEILVRFEWKAVPDATAYSFILKNEKGEAIETRSLKTTYYEMPLKAVKKYFWDVQALDEFGAPGEKLPAPTEFVVEGSPLGQVEFKKPETVFVRQIEFTRPLEAEYIQLKVARYNTQRSDWEAVGEFKVTAGQVLKFPPKWPGGRYQITGQAQAPYRAASPSSEISFDVATGSRSVVAENKSLIRQSIERTHGLFLQGTYVISQVSYATDLISQNKSVEVTGLTGSALLGVGYFIPNKPYGFYGTIEYGGVSLETQTHTFLSVEAFALYRMSPSRAAELQFKLGFGHRELPEVVGTSPAVTVESAKLLGPAFGAEYWHSLNPKWAVKGGVLARALGAGTSARGIALQSSSSLSLGLAAAYKHQPGLAALLGYNFRSDSISYQDSNLLLGVEGTGSTKTTGHYIELTLEYDY